MVSIEIISLAIFYLDILKEVFVLGYLSTAIIIALVYILILQKGSHGVSLFIILCYFSVWVIIFETISVTTGTFIGAGNTRIWIERIVLNVIFLSLFSKFFRQRLTDVFPSLTFASKFLSALGLMIFATYSLMLFISQIQEDIQPSTVAIFLMVSLLSLLMAIVALKYLDEVRSLNESNLIKIQNEHLSDLIDSYTDAERQMARIRHDFHHHMQAIAQMAKEGDDDGILEYLEDYASKEKTPSKNVCTDTVVNNIISSYMDRAGSKDTVLNLNIQKDITLPIGNSDKVAILANILENALEGCMSADRRVIDLSIVSKGRKIILKCRNDCDRSLVLKDGEYIGFAGTGMNSIIDTVNRNNGDVLFTAENGIFECEIVFNYVQSPLKC